MKKLSLLVMAVLFAMSLVCPVAVTYAQERTPPLNVDDVEHYWTSAGAMMVEKGQMMQREGAAMIEKGKEMEKQGQMMMEKGKKMKKK